MHSFVTFLLLTGGLLLNAFPARPETSRPNIVLIVADDHGREALGCYGNSFIQTPSIDQLAADGVRFTHAFCTTASCSPSRSVLLSGLHNHANGMYGLEHQVHHFSAFDTVRSLPVLLAEAGYRTARIGKFHVAPEKVYQFQRILKADGTNNPASIGRSPVEMADQCRAFLAEPASQPFFLFFATDDPHRSNTVAADGKPIFDGSRPNPFGNRPQGYPQIQEKVYQPAQVRVPPYLPDTRASRSELANYYQSISRLDQGVGRLIEHLKSTGQYDNTLIIYLSDNGAPFPGAKTTLYEPGMRLPLLVKLPRSQHGGAVQDALVSWVDLTPTLLDFAGALPARSGLHGRSFRSVIGPERVPGWDEVYASHSLHEVTMYYPMRVLRERRYKLIYNLAHELPYPMALDLYRSATWQDVLQARRGQLGKRSVRAFLHRPRFELYDLEADPDEIHNLSDDPKHQRTLQRMQAKIKQFQQQTRDPWVSKWEFE